MDTPHLTESVRNTAICSESYDDGGHIQPLEGKPTMCLESYADGGQIQPLEEKPTIIVSESEADEDRAINPRQEPPPVIASETEADRTLNPREEKQAIIADSDGNEDRVLHPPENKLIVIFDSDAEDDLVERKNNKNGDTRCSREPEAQYDNIPRRARRREPAHSSRTDAAEGRTSHHTFARDSERIPADRMRRPPTEGSQGQGDAGLKDEDERLMQALDIDFLSGFTSIQFLLVFGAVFLASSFYAYASITARMKRMRPHKIASLLDREAVLHVRPVCTDIDRCVEFFSEVMGGFESAGLGDDKLVVFSQVALAPVIGDPTTAVPLDFRLGDTSIETFIAALQDKAKEHNFNLQCTGNMCTGDVVPHLRFHQVPVAYERKWDELRRQFVARASDARGVDIDFDPFSAAAEHWNGLKRRLFSSEL